MVAIAVWVFTFAVAAGTGLALWNLRGTSRPPMLAGLAHGGVGAAGLAILLLALRGPPRGVESGVGSFGLASAVLLVAALLTGAVLLALRRKTAVMVIHAAIAITGYVLLLAWNALE